MCLSVLCLCVDERYVVSGETYGLGRGCVEGSYGLGDTGICRSALKDDYVGGSVHYSIAKSRA